MTRYIYHSSVHKRSGTKSIMLCPTDITHTILEPATALFVAVILFRPSSLSRTRMVVGVK